MRALALAAALLLLPLAPAAPAAEPADPRTELEGLLRDGARLTAWTAEGPAEMDARLSAALLEGALRDLGASTDGVGLVRGPGFVGVGREPGEGWTACYRTYMFLIVPAFDPRRFMDLLEAPADLDPEPVCGRSAPTYASAMFRTLSPGSGWWCARATWVVQAEPATCGVRTWALSCGRGDGYVGSFWGFGNTFLWFVGGTSTLTAGRGYAPSDPLAPACAP